MHIKDIPNIPERNRRFDEITVDCYDEYEILSAFEAYVTEALQLPFAASWGKAGQGAAQSVTVLGLADMDDRQGVRLRVRAGDADEYEVPADQLYAANGDSVNAIVLDDYRAFVESGGLPVDEYEDEE